MAIAKAIQEAQTKSSWIRKMFEEGAELKKIHGSDNVFDFSIGNPDVPPPAKFTEVLRAFAQNDAPGVHGYMPNAGYPAVREKLAQKLSKEQSVSLNASHLVMSVGAAGALNSVLKAILNPGDEVIVPKPFFVEYGAYIANHGGKMVLVDCTDDFNLDITAIGAALSEKTAAVLINSPHNPTGRIYPQETIAALAALLRSHTVKSGRGPWLIADEPYREIVYNDKSVPPVLNAYENTIVVSSYSKSLSLPGERIGFAAISPLSPLAAEMAGALAYTTRILGYVNAPALMQRVVAELTEERVDVSIYAERRDAFISVLKEAGVEFAEPEGAFYLFCKVPGDSGDDVGFVNALKAERVLAVPGTGFGMSGWFRLAYCLDTKIIEASRGSFCHAVKKWIK